MSTDYRIKGARLSTKRLASLAPKLGLDIVPARNEPNTSMLTDGTNYVEILFGSNDTYVVGFTRWGGNDASMLHKLARAIGGVVVSEHEAGFSRR